MNANRVHKALLLAFCAALWGGAALAEDPLKVDFHEKDGSYSIESSFLIEADPDVVWSVLTDYEHIPNYIHNMKISQVELREGNKVLLKQEAEGGFLFFTQRIRLLLYVQEQPLKSVQFKDIYNKDFSLYKGSWTIQRDPESRDLRITYNLEAKRTFDVPAFLANDAMNGGAKDLLQALRKEMAERQQRKLAEKLSAQQLAQGSQAVPTPTHSGDPEETSSN